MMITINSQAELDKLLNDYGDLIVEDDLTINVDIALLGNIDARDIRARDITAGDIKALNIKSRNIDACDIDAWNIKAWDITARNIDALNIDARNIDAQDISYYAFCIAYSTFTCKSVKGGRGNAKHFCLDSEISYGK